MPTTAASSRPEYLVERLDAGADIVGGGGGPEKAGALLQVLREVKNQIIGNKTKKVLYVHLGAVPKIVSILASSAATESPRPAALIVQAVVAIGSFACGVDAGIRAVLDAGAVSHLTCLLSSPDEKIVDASARSMRMIFQSKLAPKYDMLQEKNMKFLLSLLNSTNENVTELAASIITHSCETTEEQKALCEASVLHRLVVLLKGSLNQRDASLDSIAAIVRNNSEVASKFVNIGHGKALNSIIELMKDRYPRTRLLASLCLIILGQSSSCYVLEMEIRAKLIMILIGLLEEPGRAGDEAPFALVKLIMGKEDLHKQAISVNAVEKLGNFLRKNNIEAKRLEGILLALAELCSTLEKCRCQLMSLQVFDLIVSALKHDCVNVRTAACACLTKISRSVENLSAGRFANESLLNPLVELLHDPCTSVQVASLRVVCNIIINFSARYTVFVNFGVIKELVELSKSMDSELRLNAVWALRNLVFMSERLQKEDLLLHLTKSNLASLVTDAETSVQEQALALVRNLVDGCAALTDHLFEGGKLLEAVKRQIHNNSAPEVRIQGIYLFSNVATGSEAHKEAVINCLLHPQQDENSRLFIIDVLKSTNAMLKTAMLWCVINLTYPDSPNASSRASRLSDAGVFCQIRSMVDDPWFDVKYRAQTALQQFTRLGCR